METLKSPLTDQYNELKTQYPNHLILFKCGDFYEALEESAVLLSKLLEIPLTKSRFGNNLAGFPYHKIDEYLPKLIKTGQRVAIVENPGSMLKPIKRK